MSAAPGHSGPCVWADDAFDTGAWWACDTCRRTAQQRQAEAILNARFGDPRYSRLDRLDGRAPEPKEFRD